MFKGFIAGIILAVAVAVYFLGQIALVAAAGIALGLIMGEIVDAMGRSASQTRKGGEGRVKSRELQKGE